MNKVVTIGWNTFREVTRHPAYYIVLGLFGLFVSSSYYLSVFQLREDVAGEVVQMGIASMTLCALCLAVLGSSKVIYEEIEKKTVLTILSKPVDREQFLLGKFAGIFTSVAVAIGVLFVVLTIVTAVATSSPDETEGTAGLGAILAVTGRGALLAVLQAAILTAVAVVVSVWFPFEVNAVLLVLFFFTGHMSGRVRSYFAERGWTWVGKGIYYLVPNLEDFSIDRAIATESPVSNAYLGWASGYGLAITASILFIGLLLFRERELA